MDTESHVVGTIRFVKISGVIFMDMGIHDINLARWYLSSGSANVYAMGGSCLTAPHGYHVETEIVGTKAAMRS